VLNFTPAVLLFLHGAVLRQRCVTSPLLHLVVLWWVISTLYCLDGRNKRQYIQHFASKCLGK
jgi:hypothetical protein